MNSITKRFMALILSSVILVLSLGGCDENGNPNTSSTGSSFIPGFDDVDWDSEQDEVINVSDYGAIPNDGKDDGLAIRRAIGAAGSTRSKVTVNLEPGVYNISSADENSPEETYHAFYLQDMYNVAIQGDKTTIMLDDPFLSGFYFTGGGGFSIDGITIDYSIDPWAQGTVTAVNKSTKTFTIKLNNSKNNKSVLDDERWVTLRKNRTETSPFGMVRDDEQPKLLKQGMSNYFTGFKGATKNKDGTYTITMKDDSSNISWLGTNIKVGSKLVLNNRIDSCGAFRFVYSNGKISITHCNVYASVGTLCCIGRVNGDLTIDNLNVSLKDDRWTTSNADGLYLSEINGKVSVTNSTLEGLSDDCVNLYVRGNYISEVISGTKIKVVGTQVPEKGDKITVINPMDGSILGTAMVDDAVESGSGDNLKTDITTLLTLDTFITGMQVGQSTTTGSVVIRHDMQSPGSVFENNTFRYGRAKGIKLGSRNTLVSGNTFENIGYSGVTLHDIPNLSENAGTDKIIIEKNSFKNCCYMLNKESIQNATISIYGMTASGGTAKDYIHSNIKILDNNITNVFRNGMYISNAAKLTITGNKITGLATDGNSQNALILLDKVKQAKVNNNTLTDSRRLSSAICILPTAFKNIKYEDNVFNISSGVTKVDDRRDEKNR